MRSYVLRQGRLTPAQQRAIQQHWPKLGLDWPISNLDLNHCFGRKNKKVLEIGCGNGEAIVYLARQFPEKDFVGVEVHQPGIGQILLQCKKYDLHNIRLINHDAKQVVEEAIPNNCFDEIFILFADPWPKKRHHKRRLIQHDFIDHLVRILKPKGVLYIATDWQDYCEHIIQCMQKREDLQNIYADELFMPTPVSHRPETKYERRARRLGHHVWDLAYTHSSISK